MIGARDRPSTSFLKLSGSRKQSHHVRFQEEQLLVAGDLMKSAPIMRPAAARSRLSGGDHREVVDLEQRPCEQAQSSSHIKGGKGGPWKSGLNSSEWGLLKAAGVAQYVGKGGEGVFPGRTCKGAIATNQTSD